MISRDFRGAQLEDRLDMRVIPREVSYPISIHNIIHSSYPMPTHITNHRTQTNATRLTPIITPALSTPAPLLVGCSFATVVATEPVAVHILAPHAYPLGQQPPPAVSAQLNQPPGHLPVPPEELDDPVIAGATIVLPSDVNVVEDVFGQEVVSQSRFVWQQPPL